MILSRFAYTPTETIGRLIIGSWSCFMIGPPWVRGEYPGGKPFVSCVPDGTYRLVRYDSPSRGYEVLVLVNPALGVYMHEHDMPEDNEGVQRGRFMCQIHVANFPWQVEGCLAPGLNLSYERDGKTGKIGPMVSDSNAAFIEMMRRAANISEIEIRQAPGAIDVPLR